MTRRVIEVSEQPVRMSIRLQQLKLLLDDVEVGSIPLEELAMVIVTNPRCSYSHSTLVGLAEHNVSLIACDERHLPAAILMPMVGHTLQTERVALQIGTSRPMRKQLWQNIVRQKIRMQAALLHERFSDDGGLSVLIPKVRSGDPTNVEARAARAYWQRLFGDSPFRRNADAEDQNRLLNYGYAILRALVARAVVGVGLHPSIGLHHHNRYDPFALADDVMEPMRPFVDRRVANLVRDHGPDVPLDKDSKGALIGLAHEQVMLDSGMHEIVDVLRHVAASLVDVLSGQRRDMVWPKL
jgi:CRISP-associated protein Cas1